MRLDELTQGSKIKVIKSFEDFDGQKIEIGSEWTFKKYTYFPYDGGYTFYFIEGVMRMAEISSGEDFYVFEHTNEYFELIN
jgi:Domain of unknown function (DUF3601)